MSTTGIVLIATAALMQCGMTVTYVSLSRKSRKAAEKLSSSPSRTR